MFALRIEGPSTLYALAVHGIHLGQTVVSKDVSNNVSHPMYISAVCSSLSHQEVESMSLPPSSCIGPVTAILHRMWQK